MAEAGRTVARRLREVAGLAWQAAAGPLTAYLIMSLAGAGVPVAAAWLTKDVIDHLVGEPGGVPLLWLGAGLAVLGLVAAVAPRINAYLHTELDRAIRLTAQDRLFQAVGRFTGLARFEDPQFADRIRLARQTGGASPAGAVDGGFGLLRGALTITGFVGSLAAINAVLTVAVLLTGIPVVAAQLLLARRSAAVAWRIGPAERREIFYAELLANAPAAKEVRLFGIGGFLRRRMLTERRAADAALRRVDREELWAQLGLGVLGAVVAGAGLIWALMYARDGRISVGDVSMFVAAVAGVQGSLAALAVDIGRLHQSLLMFGHYLAVLDAPADLPSRRPARPLPPLRQGIEFRDVWFRYGPEQPWVLSGLDLTIPHGGTVALIGLNGAGKSTLVKLLCRFYDPQRGAILWDGVDLRDVEVEQLRERIGAVFQDYMEYELTAAENIAVGDLTALERPDRITAAAARAGIHERLSGLAAGYDTMLSRVFRTESDTADAAGGVLLSGGQWQRVALARAFLREGRDLLVLDEPSAGLDAEAEHEIHARLRAHRQNRTSLLISHRLGTIRDADRIVVLAGGRVVEHGNHAGLLAAGGEYARLFALQADGYHDEPAPAGRPEVVPWP
jgi:ATP-binding cassette subfamily B protein